MGPSRYERQLGLVNQRQIGDLVVLVDGSGEPLTYLLINLVLLGVGTRQGAILIRSRKGPVRKDDVRGQFLLTTNNLPDGDDLLLGFDDELAYTLEDLNSEARIIPVNETFSGPVHAHLLVPGLDERGQLQPLPETVCVWGQVGRASVYVGHEPIRVPPHEPNFGFFAPRLRKVYSRSCVRKAR